MTPSAPHLARGFNDQPQLRLLLVDRQRIALDSRGEAALRRQAELLERNVFCRLVEATLQIVLALERRAFARYEPQNHFLSALRYKTQRLEPAGARIVVFKEKPIDRQLAEQRLGDMVVPALRHPGRTEIAAAHVRAYRHASRL